MRKFIVLFAISLLVVQCDVDSKKENDEKQDLSKQVSIKKLDSIITRNVLENDKCPAVKKLFSLNGYLYDIKTTGVDISRQATLKCFIELYENEFKQLIEEEILVISTDNNEDLSINLKRLEFNDVLNAESIFQAYSKGFHDNCIGIKEPHILLLSDKTVYIFYVAAERKRDLLNEFRLSVIEDLSECEKYKISRCCHVF